MYAVVIYFGVGFDAIIIINATIIVTLLSACVSCVFSGMYL